MVNGAILVPFDARNFCLEVGDPLVELRHRHRIEILSGKLRHRIIGTARKILFGIHGQKR